MIDLSRTFKDIAQNLGEVPIRVLISDIHGTLLHPKNEALEKMLLWANAQDDVTVRLASDDALKANKDIQSENLDPALKAMTVEDKNTVYEELSDANVPFAVIDDNALTAALYGASLIMNPKSETVKTFLAEEKYKYPAP